MMDETRARLYKVDSLITKIRLNVDRMPGLSDDEIRRILAALDTFKVVLDEEATYIREEDSQR